MESLLSEDRLGISVPSVSCEGLFGLASSDIPPDMALFLVKPSLDRASILDLSGVGSLKEMLRLGILRVFSSPV